MKKPPIYFFLFALLMMLTEQIASASTSAMMEEVYMQLKTAIGDAERVWPQLEIRPGANSVLAYNKRRNIIFIDEKALEVCASFGVHQKDAFAFLLAHEMTHFYQEHHWQEAGFATSFLTNKQQFETHIADEKEADLFGAFVTHLAGYQSIKIVPAIFDKVYAAYGLREQLQDYPSLTQRKETVLEVCGKVTELIQVFETANYLTLLGEYTSAAAAYEYVLQFVKYKELYNNIGVNLVAAASLQPDNSELAFRYPIALDLEIPLREGADADKKELLQKAIEYLTIASQMDNQHFSIFINLLCAYTLSKQYDKTKPLIEQLYLLVKERKQVAALSIIQGIINAQLNKREEAIRLFREAIDFTKETGSQQLAEYNLGLISGTNSPYHPPILANTSEKIDKIDLTYQNDFPFKAITIQDHFSYEEKIIAFHQSQNATLTHVQTSDKTIALLTTENQQQRTQKNISIGTTFQQLRKTYRTNFKIINHSNGYYLCFPSHKLVFNMNSHNQVTAWGTFEIY